MNKPSQPEIVSQGIQDLIDTIREKGVAEGQSKAARIVADAEARAEWILHQAREQAEQLRQTAEAEARFIREAGADALRLAQRDLLLRVRDELSVHLARQLQLMVGQTLRLPETIPAILLTLAGRLNGKATPDTVEIPEVVAGIEFLRSHPEALHQGDLPKLLSAAVTALLESGVQVIHDPRLEAGVRLHYADGTVLVELNEMTLTTALLAYLQPRFRALLEGVVS